MKLLRILLLLGCILCTIEQYVYSTHDSVAASYKVREKKSLNEKNLQADKKCDINKKIQEDIKKIDEEKLLKFLLVLTELRK